jgi:hypothetical protein
MIITVTSARQTEDDLVGVSAVEVNRDHPQSGQCQRLDGDQHELLPGSWMISRGVPRRMWRATMIVYPIPVGLFSRGQSPGVDRCRRRTAPSPREAASTTGSGGVSGEPSCWVLIIFVVTTAVAKGDRRCLVSVGASASLPGWKRQLPGTVPAVPWSWPSRCRPGVVAGSQRGRGGRRVGIADLGRGGRSAVSWSRLV